MNPHKILRAEAARVWTAALRAADPERAVRKFLKRDGSILQINRNRFNLDKVRKTWILGAGKAAAPMGRAVEKILGRYAAGGILVTKYGHGLPLKRLEVVEAGHPWPDLKSIDAGNRIVSFINSRIEADDLVICLFSGGASALLVSPARGITLKDKLICTRLFMDSGADIYELNAIRKHLSDLKGGGLARSIFPAKIVSLILSDVVGDDVGTIASGPVSPDPTTFGECLEICRKRQLLNRIPAAVRKRFEQGAAGRIAETPKPGDPVFGNNKSFIVGSSAQACGAAARAASDALYTEKNGKVSCTLNIASIDLESNTVVLSRNNPSPIFICLEDHVDCVDTDSAPLGIRRNIRPVISEVEIKPRLTIVMYTDGLTHAGKRRGQPMDVCNAIQAMLDEQDPTPRELADALLAHAVNLDENRPADDISVVVLKVTANGGDQVRRMNVRLPLTASGY